MNATTDIRIDYPATTRSTGGFAACVESHLHDAGINLHRIDDMPSHLVLTIATHEIVATANALARADLL